MNHRDIVNILNTLNGYPDAREWTDEEKDKQMSPNQLRNAKEEFLRETQNKTVLCALIQQEDLSLDSEDFGNKINIGILQIGFSQSKLETFLEALNFQYDAGYGSQQLFGYIWYTDGTWSERGEYDGAEWWEYKSQPKIPKKCAAR